MYDYKKALIPYPQKIEDKGGLKLIAKEARPAYKLIVEAVPSEVFDSAVELLNEALSGLVMPVCDRSLDFVYGTETPNDNSCTYTGIYPISETIPELYRHQDSYLSLLFLQIGIYIAIQHRFPREIHTRENIRIGI